MLDAVNEPDEGLGDGPCESDPYGCGVMGHGPEVPSDVVNPKSVSWDDLSPSEQKKISDGWTDAQPFDDISEATLAETEIDVS